MPTSGDWLAGGLISLAFLALVAMAELWRKFGSPEAEWTRKLVHIGGGIVCLALPFVVDSHWVVLAMAVGMVSLFIVASFTGWLKSLHGVERQGTGVELYPIVIYTLFLLAHDRPWKYVICVLVLAVSDASAALIGRRYGTIGYEVDGERKSLQGSLACLLATFVVVLVPLLIWQDSVDEIPGTVSCILASLLVAMLATAFEAVALRGRDNLWVPLGTYVVLTKILRQDTAEMAVQNVSLVLICLVVALAAWRSQAFNVGGTLVFILAVYGAWSLGSFYWALPAFMAFGVYIVVLFASRDVELYKVRPVVRALLLPFLAVAAANAAFQFENEAAYNFFYGPYLAGCAAVVVQRTWSQIRMERTVDAWRRPAGVLLLAAVCWALITFPAWFVVPDAAPAAVLYIGSVSAAVGLAHDRLIGRDSSQPAERQWYVLRMLTTTAAMAAVALLQIAGVCPVWTVWPL